MSTTLTHKAYETVASVLTTELNSLANGSYTSASAAQGADGTGGNLFMDLELVLASLNPTASVVIDVYLLRSADGTNYPDVPSSTNPASNEYVGSFVVATGSAAKRDVIPDVPVPPGLWKMVAKNASGVALAASGNTIKTRQHNLLNT